MDGQIILTVAGIDVKVSSRAQAIDLLRDLTRVIPVHANGDGPKQLSAAVREIFVEDNSWRSPQDVLRLIKARQEVRAGDRTYQRVYYTLRHGNFEKNADSKWKLVG